MLVAYLPLHAPCLFRADFTVIVNISVDYDLYDFQQGAVVPQQE
jgi:hypothetical protein